MTLLMPTLRKATFGVVILFSLIILALSAHVTSSTIQLVGVYFSFSALGIATSLLSLLSLPAMLVLDKTRKGAVTSMIIVELSWLGFLWVLWLSTAARASQVGAFFRFGCTDTFLGATCGEIRAIQAFSYLTWLALFGYVGLLTFFTVMAGNRGYSRVWYQSVKETDFNAPPMANNQFATQNVGAPQMAYPPQQGAPGWNGQHQSPQGV